MAREGVATTLSRGLRLSVSTRLGVDGGSDWFSSSAMKSDICPCFLAISTPEGTRRMSGDGVAGAEGHSTGSLRLSLASFLVRELSERVLAMDPWKDFSEGWRGSEAVNEGVVGAADDEPAVEKGGLIN